MVSLVTDTSHYDLVLNELAKVGLLIMQCRFTYNSLLDFNFCVLPPTASIFIAAITFKVGIVLNK